jgi:hypothetical protein
MGPEDPYADASAAPSPLVELVAEASLGVSPEDISADACAAFSPCVGLLTEAASGMGPEDPDAPASSFTSAAMELYAMTGLQCQAVCEQRSGVYSFKHVSTAAFPCVSAPLRSRISSSAAIFWLGHFRYLLSWQPFDLAMTGLQHQPLYEQRSVVSAQACDHDSVPVVRFFAVKDQFETPCSSLAKISVAFLVS